MCLKPGPDRLWKICLSVNIQLTWNFCTYITNFHILFSVRKIQMCLNISTALPRRGSENGDVCGLVTGKTTAPLKRAAPFWSFSQLVFWPIRVWPACVNAAIKWPRYTDSQGRNYMAALSGRIFEGMSWGMDNIHKENGMNHLLCQTTVIQATLGHSCYGCQVESMVVLYTNDL